MSVVEALALLLALPETIVALRELWARRGIAGRTTRPRTEIAVNFRLNLQVNLRR
ncbi:MAG TPA: hypothetical protein VK721_11210 [Solirubrobacteraceae bacterium]|nr:hypothetical protein [Solirubrobacteraceae bacterium]